MVLRVGLTSSTPVHAIEGFPVLAITELSRISQSCRPRMV